MPVEGTQLDTKNFQGGISHFDSTEPSGPVSKSPTYSTQETPSITIKL
jgi:hypothetical protein